MHSHHRVSFLYILLLFQRASKTRFDVLLFVCSGRYYTLGDIYSGDIFTENKRIPQARAAAAAKPTHIHAIEPFSPFIFPPSLLLTCCVQAMKAHEIATRINPDYAEAYMSLAMLCGHTCPSPPR